VEIFTTFFHICSWGQLILTIVSSSYDYTNFARTDFNVFKCVNIYAFQSCSLYNFILLSFDSSSIVEIHKGNIAAAPTCDPKSGSWKVRFVSHIYCGEEVFDYLYHLFSFADNIHRWLMATGCKASAIWDPSKVFVACITQLMLAACTCADRICYG
jgi:hypothetical protein